MQRRTSLAATNWRSTMITLSLISTSVGGGPGHKFLSTWTSSKSRFSSAIGSQEPQHAQYTVWPTLIHHFLVAAIFCSCLITPGASSQPGFVSLACGANTKFTDALNIEWIPDTDYISSGRRILLTNISSSNSSLKYLREFPEDSKNCYTLPTTTDTRYLVRATFLYGNYDKALTNPTFDITINATTFATVRIINSTYPYVTEVVALGTGSSFSVCLVNRNEGTPFISSLELRPLMAGMYGLPYLNEAYLASRARISFGAPSNAPIRYPHDPVDRIWASDRVSLPINGNIQDLSGGVVTNSTTRDIDVNQVSDRPPVEVMQSGVIGTHGVLTYRLDLEDFPGQAYALAYFAEIQTLKPSDIRSFSFNINTEDTTFVDQPLNIQDAAGGPYITFEPTYVNVSLPQFVKFSFARDPGSTLDPLLNAMEIYKIVPKVAATFESDVLSVVAVFGDKALGGEDTGDPCLPVAWNWVTCTGESPPRISSINLARRNLMGRLASNISALSGLQHIDLSSNNFEGPIPDFSFLSNLRIVHLENNHFSGHFPEWITSLTNLTEFWVQNNSLTGIIPQMLLNKPGLQIRYEANPDLCKDGSCRIRGPRAEQFWWAYLIGGLVAVCIVTFGIYKWCLRKMQWKQKKGNQNSQDHIEEVVSKVHSFGWCGSVGVALAPDSTFGQGARCFNFADLKKATGNFSKKIGEGGFGKVFQGQIENNIEVAVKVLSKDSQQGVREFTNEVTLLSRVHHRNLVSLIGYCLEGDNWILVYEHLAKGSLWEHLHGELAQSTPLDWTTRLRIALDAAKGLEYLHTGCSPSIIHRDVKSRNILLTKNMVAKMGDFGLSKIMDLGESSHVTSNIRGTVGYLSFKHLTTKSDIYSFGIVLLEIISGRLPLAPSDAETSHYLINDWAKSIIQKGHIEELVDPMLNQSINLDIVGQVVEVAMKCIAYESFNRPTMSQVVKEFTNFLDHSIGECSMLSPANLEWLVNQSSNLSNTEAVQHAQILEWLDPAGTSCFGLTSSFHRHQDHSASDHFAFPPATSESTSSQLPSANAISPVPSYEASPR